jgi:glutamate synthase (NADPH/NADH) small chain
MPENPWPAWPLVLRTSSSHDEGCGRDFAVMTTRLVGEGRVEKLVALRLPEKKEEIELSCDLVLLAMGFVAPEKKGLVQELGLALDVRGNIVTDPSGATSVKKVFAAGDASRGQSLVVWAIADGRRVAAGVNAFLGDVRLRAVG